MIKKMWKKITFWWALYFGKRYIGVDYGNYDCTAGCVWFKHQGKIYITDIITNIEDEPKTNEQKLAVDK